MAKKISDSELYYLGDKVVLLGKNELRERLYHLVKGVREIQKTMVDDDSLADLDELVESVLDCREPREYGTKKREALNVTCYIDNDTSVTWYPKPRVFCYRKNENGQIHHRLLAAKKNEH